MTDWGGRLSNAAVSAMASDVHQNNFLQLRAAATLDAVRPEGGRLPAFTFDDFQIASLAYLVRLSELERTSRKRRQDPRFLPTVAAAFEDLAHREVSDTARRAELLGEAATMWSIAGYQANAAVIAREMDALVAGQDSVPARIVQLVASLLQRDILKTQELGHQGIEDIPALGEQVLHSLQNEQLPIEDAAVLATYGIIARAANSTVDFWYTGNRQSADYALSELNRAESILRDQGIVDTWLLVSNLRIVLGDAFSTSLWRTLRGQVRDWNYLWRRHIQNLASGKSGVVEIWPSQRRALEAGFLNPDVMSLVVTMPTSAGKTRLSEFAILASLCRNIGETLAVYVVPTRALAAEVETRLTASLGLLGLRVTSLFGGFDYIDYERLIVDRSDVLVVTAEKLDLLLRREPSLLDRLNLVIFDEAHLIDSPHRGIRYELLITRILRNSDKTRILMLSAVIPNPNDLGRWLNPEEAGRNVATSDWSPSRLAMGIFTWEGRNSVGQTGTVRYQEHQEFFLPYVLERTRLKKNLYPDSPSDIAAELALHYVQIGPVLVGAARKVDAESVVKRIDAAIKRHKRAGREILLTDTHSKKRLEVIASEVAQFTSSTHILPGFIRQGFAYHHADLPDEVRRLIEGAYKENLIRILTATSTLSQGVNLPTRTVIVSHTNRGRNVRMSAREFRNLAGRAGRAFTETEGHVILVAKNERIAVDLRNRYISPSQLELIYGALFKLIIELIRLRVPSLELASITEDIELGIFNESEVDGQLLKQLSSIDTQLLALIVEDVIDTDDEESIESLLQSTLCAIHLENHSIPLSPVGRFLGSRLQLIRERIPSSEVQEAYHRTGLSLDGCDLLYKLVEQLVSGDRILVNEGSLSIELIKRLLEVAILVPEISETCEERGVDPPVIADVAFDWLAGMSLEEIHANHGISMKSANVMETSKTLEIIVARELPWVVSSAIEFLNLLLGDEWQASTELNALPSMVKFGVSNLGACYAASLGIRRRTTALSLGYAFETENGQTFSSFVHWLQAVDLSRLSEIVGTENVADVSARIANLSTNSNDLRNFAVGRGVFRSPIRGVQYGDRWEHLQSMRLNEPVILERENDNTYDPNAIRVHDESGNDIGYIARDSARLLAPLIDDGIPARSTLVSFRGSDAIVEIAVG